MAGTNPKQSRYNLFEKKMLAVKLNYMDLGNAPVQAGNGIVTGEFDERYAIILDVSLRWITGGKALIASQDTSAN